MCVNIDSPWDHKLTGCIDDRIRRDAEAGVYGTHCLALNVDIRFEIILGGDDAAMLDEN